MAATEPIRVTLVLAPAPRLVLEATLVLNAPCRVDEAWAHTDWSRNHAEAAPDQAWTTSIWGRKVSGDTPLRDGDRLEWVRPLKVDPKVARRERFKGQGVRGAGLFSRRKPSP